MSAAASIEILAPVIDQSDDDLDDDEQTVFDVKNKMRRSG